MTTFTCPNDPTHTVRIERFGHPDRNAYCSACMKHYPLCNTTQFMNICEREKNHEGKHRDDRGTEW